MKKKIFVLFVTFVIILGAVASTSAAQFSDVSGHLYEKAVNELSEEGIISGYPDGTFQPDGTLTRAETVKLVVSAMGSDITNTKASGFSDTVAWADKYIYVAVSKELVEGYADGTFRPNANITEAELLTILVRACGYSTLEGTWPTNYLSQADSLGITKDININANERATRGLTAQLLSNALPSIKKDVADPDDENIDTPDSSTETGDLSNHSGTLIGVITEISAAANPKNVASYEIKFLLSDKAYTLYTDGEISVPSDFENLYACSMYNGLITDIYVVSEDSISNYELLADNLEVVDKDSSFVTVNDAGTEKHYELAEKVAVYEATYKNGTFDQYKRASLSSVKAGKTVSLYDVTNDKITNVNIIIVK